MAAAGLLQQPSSTVFMELGAGKGWLTALLHMLTPDSKEFVLLDKVGNFHNKVGLCWCGGVLMRLCNRRRHNGLIAGKTLRPLFLRMPGRYRHSLLHALESLGANIVL